MRRAGIAAYKTGRILISVYRYQFAHIGRSMVIHMKPGKLPENVLKRSVLNRIETKRDEVLVGAGIGEDCAVLSFGEQDTLVSADSSACDGPDAAVYAIHSAVNDLAAAGAEPVAVLLSALLPGGMEEAELRQMTERAEAECAALHIQAAGGDTRITDAVSRTVIVACGVGKRRRECSVSSRNIKPGQDIVLSKWIGLQGTSLIAKRKEKELLSRYPSRLIREAKAFDRYLSIVPEAAAALKSGAASMHDVTEGGIFGGLWELSESAGVGLDVELKKIPVRQETVEVCEFFTINPYMLAAGGCLLMTADNGYDLVRALEKEDIPAAVIGKITGTKDRVVTDGEEIRFLEPPVSDELYRVI